MKHSHSRDTVGLFHVALQDMAFIGKAERPFRNGFPPEPFVKLRRALSKGIKHYDFTMVSVHGSTGLS